MFRETDVNGRRLLLRRIGSGGDGGNGKHDDVWCGGDVVGDDGRGRGGWGGKASKVKMEGVA